VTSRPEIVARIAERTDADLLAATVDDWRRRWRERVIDAEREHDDPWALPLVVRVERAEPPTHEDAVHAAALSVVALLTRPEAAPIGYAPDGAPADPDQTGAGPWHAALARWSEGWIRKVVRRARASRWQEIGALPGATASVAGAEVRALVPHPVVDPPPALARLQISGLDLPKQPDAEPYAPPDGSSPILTIVMAPGLTLTTGKACAQVGHAAQLALLQLDRETVLRWAADGHPLRVAEATARQWQRLLDAPAGVALVQDGGFTEVAPGTRTCAASFGRLD
jgi:peptidyl-tRNA hydrolase